MRIARSSLASLVAMDTLKIDLTEDRTLGAQAETLVDAAEQADGVAPFSEQFLLGLHDPRLGHHHLVVLDEDRLLAVAGIEGDTAELVVHPQYRRRGVGAALYDALEREIPGINVWAHGDLAGARALAEKKQLQVTRELLVFEITGKDLARAAEFEAPEGFSVANLADSRQRSGVEAVNQAWLAANNDAFSWHPEQGGWDLDRLERAQEVDWFRAEDVLFLWDEKGEEPQLAGFHWTKWHHSEDPEFGEVYVVGLAADYRGRGLGAPVLKLGLAHLHENCRADRVILYVEADNTAAVKVYQNSGFSVAERHIVYTKS